MRDAPPCVVAPTDAHDTVDRTDGARAFLLHHKDEEEWCLTNHGKRLLCTEGLYPSQPWVLLRSGSQLGISTNQASARAAEVVRGCYTVRSVVAVGTDTLLGLQSAMSGVAGPAGANDETAAPVFRVKG